MTRNSLLIFIALSTYLSINLFNVKTSAYKAVISHPEIRQQKVAVNLSESVQATENIILTKRGVEINGQQFSASVISPEITIPLVNPEPFLAVAPLINMLAADDQVSLSYRSANSSESWSEWENVEFDRDVSPRSSNQLTVLLFLAKETAKLQFKLHLTRSSLQDSPLITGMEVTFISPGKTPDRVIKEPYHQPYITEQQESNIAKYPKPQILSRTGWGCPDGQGNPRSAPGYTTVSHLIVHHTAGSNTSSDWPAVVRSIWNFHVFTNGWNDIGYNYLIDPNGVIYEGRGGGDDVLGAHFSCQNANTMGVSLIGTFTSVLPTNTAMSSLKEILSWKADQRGINPFGSTFHNGMQQSLANISGHRDGNNSGKSCTVTECPGDRLYPMLPNIRTEVSALVNPANDFTLSANLTKQVIAKGGIVKYQINSAGTGGSQNINLSLQNVPTGIGYNFTAPVISTGNSSQLTLNISDSVPSGSYTLAVIGSGSTKRVVELTVVIAGKVASVSAASYLPAAPVASESIVSAFGINLATETKLADKIPLPTTLANVAVKIKDSTNYEVPAPLFFVSPNQINYQIPPELARGLATVTVVNGAEILAVGDVQITKTAPGLFSANADAAGVAAAVIQRRKADGSDVFELVARYDEVQKRFVPNLIDVSEPTEQVFLLLFGTGIRFRNTDVSVSAQIGGVEAEVLYAGKQPDFIGVDQINLRLASGLAGRGQVNIVVNIGEQATNTVSITCK